MSMIRKGWSQNIETLQSIQDGLFSTYMQTASKKTTEKLPEIIAINNVNIFNSIDSHLQRNMQLIIKNGRIVEINSTAKTFDDAKQIDGTNKTLMAGLWDTHLHTALEDGLFNITSGVTNVRDVGSVYDELLQISSAYDINKVIGPNIYLVGLIDKKQICQHQLESLFNH
jgi:imidazolonepropionase-like amidohydrolase